MINQIGFNLIDNYFSQKSLEGVKEWDNLSDREKEFLKEFAYNVIDNKLSFSEAIKVLSGNRKLTDLEIKKLEPLLIQFVDEMLDKIELENPEYKEVINNLLNEFLKGEAVEIEDIEGFHAKLETEILAEL